MDGGGLIDELSGRTLIGSTRTTNQSITGLCARMLDGIIKRMR